MKALYGLLIGIISFLPNAGHAANTANATIFCYSLQFQRGSEPNGYYYLDLSSSSFSVNGELALDFFNSGYTHSAYLSLEDTLFGDTLSGQMALNVPTGGDANKDGYPDFFQLSQGITNLTSSGVYNVQVYGSGNLTATWNRPAGSSYGTCILTGMRLMPSQPVTFSHTFQVLEYKGPLTYTPGTNQVTGNIQLLQSDTAAGGMTGAVVFVKTLTNHFNALILQPGTWTNESAMPVFYTNDLYLRDLRWPTNYFGYLEFVDPSNPGALYPYGTWLLSIDDTNDVNHNTIPDFSDDPSGASPPRPPQLQLAQGGTNLVLTVHGDVGRINDIQTTADLGSANWQTAMSVTITNDPQTLSVPTPTGPTTFWRVRAR